MATEMTSAEIDEFLESQRTLVLVTLRPDGSPVAHAMWFAKLGAALYVNTPAGSLKSNNIAADPRVCAMIEAGESYFELRGVRIEGACQRVDDSGELARVAEAQAQKEVRIGSGLADLPEWFGTSRSGRLGRGERAVLRIPMDRVFSWDFSKARAHYERSASDSEGSHS